DTVTVPSGVATLLSDLLAVPPLACGMWMQVITVGAGSLPMRYRMDGDDTQTDGLLLPLLGEAMLTNKRELQQLVLIAAEAGVEIAVQFFSSNVAVNQ